MSAEVRSIIDAVRGLTADQHREFVSALAAIDRMPREASVDRRRLVASIRGKYRDQVSPSDEFMRRKAEETERE